MASTPLRTELAGRLMTVQNNYVLGLAALSMFATPEAIATLRNSRATMETAVGTAFAVEFDQVWVSLSNPSTRDESTKAFLVMSMCTLIKDSYELTRHHAKKAGFFRSLQDQPWYHFCRIIRNCIAHNYLIEFSEKDLTLLPISWRGRTITAAMNNTELSLIVF
jgi:hypothetical protein